MSIKDLIPKLGLLRAVKTYKRQGFNRTVLGHWKQASKGIIKLLTSSLRYPVFASLP